MKSTSDIHATLVDAVTGEVFSLVGHNDRFELDLPPVVAWYAVKIHYQLVEYLLNALTKMELQTYVAKDVLPSVIFVKASIEQLMTLKDSGLYSFYIYGDCETRRPKVIPESEMKMFILVTKAGGKDIIDLGPDDPFFHQGEKVRIIDGIFKGAEGVIKRIKGNNRLVVTVTGISAIATNYIPSSFVEKID